MQKIHKWSRKREGEYKFRSDLMTEDRIKEKKPKKETFMQGVVTLIF